MYLGLRRLLLINLNIRLCVCDFLVEYCITFFQCLLKPHTYCHILIDIRKAILPVEIKHFIFLSIQGYCFGIAQNWCNFSLWSTYFSKNIHLIFFPQIFEEFIQCIYFDTYIMYFFKVNKHLPEDWCNQGLNQRFWMDVSITRLW